MKALTFERLRALLCEAENNPELRLFDISIGAFRHAPPAVALSAFNNSLLSVQKYPTTVDNPALRQAIAAWLTQRFHLDGYDAELCLPVSGTREALFAVSQALTGLRPGFAAGDPRLIQAFLT